MLDVGEGNDARNEKKVELEIEGNEEERKRWNRQEKSERKS